MQEAQSPIFRTTAINTILFIPSSLTHLFRTSIMASNDEALYYPPLAGPTFIRIITLLPSLTCSTPLQITLDPANLDLSPRPEYEALSYTWEDQLPTHTIACNAFPLQTTANVSEALNRLRCTDRPRFLWIDAICINQNDQYEKTTQLSIMGSIFAYASRVNVWLSHPTGAMTEVFQYIQMTAAADLKMPSVSDGEICPARCTYALRLYSKVLFTHWPPLLQIAFRP